MSTNYGGQRKGAGRKLSPVAVKKRMVSVRLAPEILDWLERQELGKTAIIELALRELANKGNNDES